MLNDLKVGLAGSLSEAFTTALPSETKARHRRFYENRQRREEKRNEKRQTAAPTSAPAPAPAPEIESPDSGEDSGEDSVDDGVDSPSSADESTTLVPGPTPAGQPESTPPAIASTTPPAALEATSTPLPAANPSPTPGPSPLPSPPSAPSPSPDSSPSPTTSASTAASPSQIPTALPAVDASPSSAVTSNSNPPLATVPLPTNASRSREPTVTSVSISTSVAPTSSSSDIIPQNTAPMTIPGTTLQTSRTRVEAISSTSSPSVPSAVSSTVLALKDQQPTNVASLPQTSGAGSSMISGIKSPIDGKMVAGVVLGVMGTAFIILFIVWRYMRVRRVRREDGDLEKPTMAQMVFGQTSKTRDDVNDDTSSVSRLWGGGATTAGAPTEAAYQQAYIPPSMQKGGTHEDSAYNDNRFSQIQSQMPKPTAFGNVAPLPAAIPAANGRDAPRTDDNGFIQPPNRWFGRNSSVSQASIPRFRSIKSWASDQRTRTQNTAGTEQGDQVESSKWSVSTDSRDMSNPPYGQR